MRRPSSRCAAAAAVASLLWLPAACTDERSAPAAPGPAPTSEPAAEVDGSAAASGLNGCEESSWVDASDRDAVEIVFGGEAGHNYVPQCVVARAGAAIRFLGPFATHPFVGGTVVDGLPQPSRGAQRFAPVARGDGAEFRIEEAGEYGYYCDLHVVEGMMGAVRIVEANR